MMIYNKIVKTGIVAITITALIAVYFSSGMKILCSANASESMTCCKSADTSKNSCDSQGPNTLSLQSAHKCPCPSMQTGPNQSFDEVLPNTGKAESKSQSVQCTSISTEIYTSSISELVLTGYVHSYLSAHERLSLLQTFLI